MKTVRADIESNVLIFTTLKKCIPLIKHFSKCYFFFQIQCFPLYSLLLALGNPTVNFFVLDIEGAEYLVLKTIPWDKVDIEVSTWSSRPFPGTRWTSRSVLGPQDHPLGHCGHRGQYMVLKTIPWNKVDIEVSTWSSRPSPGTSWTCIEVCN